MKHVTNFMHARVSKFLICEDAMWQSTGHRYAPDYTQSLPHVLSAFEEPWSIQIYHNTSHLAEADNV
jgi:hypothetical protein